MTARTKSAFCILLLGFTLAGCSPDNQIKVMAQAARVPLKRSELEPPFDGLGKDNGWIALLSMKIELQGGYLYSNKDWNAAAGQAYLETRRADLEKADLAVSAPVFAPEHIGEGQDIELTEQPYHVEAVRLLLTRARIEADHGDLAGCIADFKKASKLGNYAFKEPWLGLSVVAMSIDAIITRCAVMVAPRFQGHAKETDDLLAVLNTFEPLDYSRLQLGETYNYVLLALSPVNFDPEYYKAHPQSMLFDDKVEGTRKEWGPKLAMAAIADLNDVRKSPNDFNAPAALMPHLKEFSAAYPQVLSDPTPNYEMLRKAAISRMVRLDLDRLAIKAISNAAVPDVAGTKDLFGQGPYKFKTVTGGWMLYSVGPDGQDNGGQIAQPGDGGPSDMVITYVDGKADLHALM